MRVYPWDKWLNGNRWTLERGAHFDIAPRQFTSCIRNTARRRGLRVRCKVTGSRIVMYALKLALLVMASSARAAEWHMIQGEPPPVLGWNVYQFGVAAPIATVLPTHLVQESVTPTRYPTPGPGTPAPTLNQYLVNAPEVPGGILITMEAVGLTGRKSDMSNVKQLDTATPTPAAIPTGTPARPLKPRLF